MKGREQALDDLVVFCVREIIRAGEECTFERLVYECFTRFPDSFSLIRYPEWPDSARVNKCWLRCRTDKGWIVGSVKEGFRLTPAGERVAEKVAKQLENTDGSRRPAQPPAAFRERYEAMLARVRRSPVFARFLESRNEFAASDMELRQMLGATLETPLRVLRQNLHAYRAAAEAYSAKEVLEFLAECEKMIVRKAQ